MSALHSQTLACTALFVVRSIDHCYACWHGATMWWMVLASSWNKVLIYLWASVSLHAQQCWNMPVSSEANPELDCWVYQGLLEAYHLRQAATGVTGVGTSKRHCSLTYFVESCATEATFLLSLLKASSPHPSTTASRYLTTLDLILFFWGVGGGGRGRAGRGGVLSPKASLVF